MATASKSKKKVPATIGGKTKNAGTSDAQKKPGPTRVSGKPGAPEGTTAAAKKKRKKKS